MTNPVPPPPLKEAKRGTAGKSSKSTKPSSSSSKQNSSSSQNRQRSLDPNFLCIPRFQNSLPSAPSGPFFVDLGMHQTFTELNKYTISSLEKNYIWQPHLGDNAGIELDLIDQESIVVSDASKQDLIDPIEYKFLSQVASSTRNKSLLGQNIQEDLSWLRKTTYLKRGLTFETKVQGHEKLMEKEQLNSDDDFNPFSPDYIESSFEDVERAVLMELESRKKVRTNASVKSSLPVLPNDYYYNQKESDQLFSVIRFDEVPVRFNTSSSVYEANPDYVASAKYVENQIVLNSIVANIRRPPGSTRVGDFAVSVLSNTSADKDSGDDVPYHLVSDYKMMQASTARYIDSFIILVNEPQVTFYPYQTRCEMKRTNFEDSGPHEAYVSRRTGEKRRFVEEEEEEAAVEAEAEAAVEAEAEAEERPMEVELDEEEQFDATTAAEE